MDVPAGYNDDITLTTPSSQVFSIPFDQSTSNNFLNYFVSPTSQENVFSNQTSLGQNDVVSPVSIEPTILVGTCVYKMIFVPFTGIDHHNKCVTFGAALISSETIDSYKWLLQSFLNCHGQQPKLVLSDQDPSMRQAVVQVSGDVIENTNVRSRIHRLVWNMFITPDTFESRWHYLIEKFGLQENEWLNDMFDIRDCWVPAYFQEIPFCCLMKTTSRCESSNATF
ncbi:protein FAR1-RELATED SEQUENCE 2-like [Bidens hawaiensis]|uniref:protein FAR1-RELATED SEQUENCE 2-like n=1 Tax=Bidens hawaiensis TaxID=980011 RepID=UPI004049AC4B